MGEKVKDPGVGIFSKERAKRFINPNGTYNVKHINRKNSVNEAYTYLIGIGWLRFFCYVFLGFLFLNTIFATLYVIIGVQNLGIRPSGLLINFARSFFFSVQTLTTLGYGFLAPHGVVAGIISSLEALIGLLSFAFITGLLYGRFSKPISNIRFSDSFLLCKHKGYDAIMFRLLSRRKSLIVLPKIKVSLMISKPDETGKGYQNDFFQLKLEREQITYLPTTWTLVHSIDKDSPLNGYNREQIQQLQGELLILFSYQDDSFNEELHQIHSYIFQDLKVGYRFKKAFDFNEEGQVVLDHNLVNKMEPEYEAVTNLKN